MLELSKWTSSLKDSAFLCTVLTRGQWHPERSERAEQAFEIRGKLVVHESICLKKSVTNCTTQYSDAILRIRLKSGDFKFPTFSKISLFLVYCYKFK